MRLRSVILRAHPVLESKRDHRAEGEIADQTGTTSGHRRDYKLSRIPPSAR